MKNLNQNIVTPEEIAAARGYCNDYTKLSISEIDEWTNVDDMKEKVSALKISAAIMEDDDCMTACDLFLENPVESTFDELIDDLWV